MAVIDWWNGPLRAWAHYVEFGWTQSRKIFCVFRRANTPVSPSCIKRSFSGQGVNHKISRPWVISPQSYLQNVAKATTCLADSTIDRRASSAWSFCRPQPFRSQCFFFQHSSVQLLKQTNEIEKQILELWANSERRTANNMVSKTTFHVRQATSMVVGWTAESGCQESTVKSVKAKWTISVERKGPYPHRIFSMMRMIRHRTFPSKDESTNGGRGHQTTKNAKKSRRNGVDAGASSALTRLRLTPRFRHFFGVVMEI